MFGLYALLAHVVFWAVLAIGWFTDELSPRSSTVFGLVWVGAYAGSSRVPQGDYLFPSLVALLDVALILIVVGRDVDLT